MLRIPHVTAASLRDSFPRILPLAWPVLIGQLAVLGLSTVDTILVAGFAANDLAALSIGMATYITIFIGLHERKCELKNWPRENWPRRAH